MSKISIGLVLSTIDQTVIGDKPQTFQIKFRKADGSLSEIKDAQKGVKHPKGSSSDGGGNAPARKFNHSIKHSGTILLYSQERNGYREVKIDLIREFNGNKVFHG